MLSKQFDYFRRVSASFSRYSATRAFSCSVKKFVFAIDMIDSVEYMVFNAWPRMHPARWTADTRERVSHCAVKE